MLNKRRGHNHTSRNAHNRGNGGLHAMSAHWLALFAFPCCCPSAQEELVLVGGCSSYTSGPCSELLTAKWGNICWHHHLFQRAVPINS
jgi:hypothetical protein